MAPYERAIAVCLAKTASNLDRLATTPKSCAFAMDGDYFSGGEGFFAIGNWTTSFFTGAALLAYEITGEPGWLRRVNRLGAWYEKKLAEHTMDTMHDLGFLYTLYSVALYKLTGETHCRRTALRAADELAKRFVLDGGYIRAWGRMDDRTSDYAGLAIIDCLMNLPLLFWAAAETGHRFYRDVAVRHADTTLRYLVREDGSVYHAYRFDPEAGGPLRGGNYCGHAVESHWARGAAWAIYGFALAYGYTRERRYLEASRRIAARFLSSLDEEIVPLWDFRLPPGSAAIRDSSAAAVAVCGLNELQRHLAEERTFAQTAEDLLSRLCSEDYLDADLACPGVLKHGEIAELRDGVGAAKSVYTSWGDYFFLEALARKVHGIRGYW